MLRYAFLLILWLAPAWGQTDLSDTLIFYHISGTNSGPPIHNLAISSGGILYLQSMDFRGSLDTLGVKLNPSQFAQIQGLFVDNGFQNLLDSNVVGACLSCPEFILAYRGDSLRGNTPTRYENLNTIMAGLDSLIQELLDTSPLAHRVNDQYPFNFYPDRLEIRFPHLVKLYDARGALMETFHGRGPKEYALKTTSSPVFIEIVDLSTGRLYPLRR